MVDIVGINSTSNQPNKVTERGSSKTTSSKMKDTPSSSPVGDRIEISANAKEASTIGRLVDLAQSESDIRPEEVEKARERLENGEYNGIEISRQTAKKMLGIPG